MPDKKQLRTIIALVIILIAYNVLAFAIPFTRTGLFWTGYIFGLVAIVVGILIFLLAFGKSETLKSKFYGFPVARVGIIYVCIQLPLSFIAMALAKTETIPNWPFLVLFVLLLSAAVLGTAAVDMTRDEVERQEKAHSGDISSMKGLRSAAEALTAQCADPDAKKALQRFADELRFSDPVSNSATKESENELKTLIADMGAAVGASDMDRVKELANKASVLLKKRNELCRLNK